MYSTTSGRASAVAEAQAGEAVDLRERAEHHDVRVLPAQRERVLEPRRVHELDVGLVEHDERVLRDRVEERVSSDSVNQVPVGLSGFARNTIFVRRERSLRSASRS